MQRIGTLVLGIAAASSWLACTADAPSAAGAHPSAAPDTASREPDRGTTEPASDQGKVEALPVLGGEAPQPTGGQSGTDLPDKTPARCPPPTPLDPQVAWAGIKKSWLVATAQRRYEVPVTLLGELVTLQIDLEQAGSAEQFSGPAVFDDGTPAGVDCDRVEVPVKVSLHTLPQNPEGNRLSVDGRESRLLLQFAPDLVSVVRGRSLGTASLDVSIQVSDFSDPSPLRATLAATLTGLSEIPPDYVPPADLRLEFTFSTEPLTPRELTPPVVIPSWKFGGALPPPAPPPDPVLPSACAAAEPTPDAAVVETPEQGLEHLVGTWALCNGSSLPGLQILPDGTWHALLPGNEPRLGAGFEREGRVVFWNDGGGEIVPPGVARPLWFDLEPRWPNSPENFESISGYLDLSPSGSTAVYPGQLVKLPQAAPAPAVEPPFAKGERAGVAGCASGEAGVDTSSISAEEFGANLAGRWVACSGFAGEVRFDPAGYIEILPNEGYVGSTEPVSFTPYQSGGGIIAAAYEWSVVRSVQPLKLWMFSRTSRSGPIVLSAMP